nr:Chain A, PNF-18 [HIV whole-genome vector AA1305\
CKFKFQF